MSISSRPLPPRFIGVAHVYVASFAKKQPMLFIYPSTKFSIKSLKDLAIGVT